MEIIVVVIALGIIAWAGYTYVLDKEKIDGSHPLDSVKGNSELPPMPVMTRTGDIVESKVETSIAVENQITDSVTQANVENKKEKKMATKKPAKPAPAKEPKKPAPAKKPKK